MCCGSWGRLLAHPHELLLAMEGIEHRTTSARSPRTDGFVERMNRTSSTSAFGSRGAPSGTSGQIQSDFDAYLHEYNLRRTHQGYRLIGRTSARLLREGLGIGGLPPFILREESCDLEPSAGQLAP